jgi:hypothetical protein
MSLVGEIHAHRELGLTAMLEGRTSKAEQTARMQLDTQQNQKDYSTLSCFQIPFHDPWVSDNLLQELYAYNHEETGSSTMCFNFQNNVSAALVMIPQSSHLVSLKKSNCRHVTEIMRNLNKDGARPEETSRDFLMMFARSDDCQEHF